MTALAVLLVLSLVMVLVGVAFPLDRFLGERRGPPKPVRPVKSVVRANDKNKWSDRHAEIIRRSQDFLPTVAGDVPPDQIGLVQLQLGESLVRAGRPEAGAPVLAAGLAALGEVPDTAWVRWTGWAMLAAATRDPSAAVMADRLFHEAGEPASPAGRFRAHSTLGNCLWTCELIGSARDELVRARDECPFSDPQSLGRVNRSLGILFQETGNFDEAERAFDLAANYLGYSGEDRHDAELTFLDWARGRPQSALDRLAGLSGPLDGDPPWVAAHRALALYDLGRTADARKCLDAAGPLEPGLRGHRDNTPIVWVAACQLWVRMWLDAGEIALAADRFEHLWSANAEAEGYLRDYMLITRARVRAATGDHAGADRAATQARAAMLSRSVRPYAAEALWVRGQGAAVAGDAVRSREYLTVALKEYEDMDHELAPGRIRADLVALDG